MVMSTMLWGKGWEVIMVSLIVTDMRQTLNRTVWEHYTQRKWTLFNWHFIANIMKNWCVVFLSTTETNISSITAPTSSITTSDTTTPTANTPTQNLNRSTDNTNVTYTSTLQGESLNIVFFNNSYFKDACSYTLVETGNQIPYQGHGNICLIGYIKYSSKLIQFHPTFLLRGSVSSNFVIALVSVVRLVIMCLTWDKSICSHARFCVILQDSTKVRTNQS